MNPQRYACFTLDFELDYGGRVKTLKTLENQELLGHLKAFFSESEIPLSVFAQTSLFKNHPISVEVLKEIASEIHSHSHHHAREALDRRFELENSKKCIEDTFGQPCHGYRAPCGKLYPGDLELLAELDYQFDSSVFPSFRPGMFNNMRADNHPGLHPSGLLEIPFSVIPKVRMILGLTYMKLAGYPLYRQLMKWFDLPEVVVFYSHLHDFIPTSDIDKLPAHARLVFNRNKYGGLEIAKTFCDDLKAKGYQFIGMSQLASKLKQAELPAYRMN